MTPLIIVPARQMSEGRPCKNRQAWPALIECLMALPFYDSIVIVTDDPALGRYPCTIHGNWRRLWRPMGPTHTISEVVVAALAAFPMHDDTDDDGEPSLTPHDPIIVLQPSSPTKERARYVMMAYDHLMNSADAPSSVVSVVPWTGEPPAKACTLAENGTLIIPPSPEPRQVQPRAYRRDGTVYAVRATYARQGDLYGPSPVPLLIDPADSVTLD